MLIIVMADVEQYLKTTYIMNQNAVGLTLFFLKTKTMRNCIFISWFSVTYVGVK